jgi:multiple sugar transport system substrate-binding protein
MEEPNVAPNTPPTTVYEETPVVTPSLEISEVGVTTPPPPTKGLPIVPILIGGGILLLLVLVFIFRGILSKGSQIKEATLTWWGLWEDDSIVTPIINEYQQKNPKIKIKYIRQSKQDYRERLTNALAKGTGPDIFRFHNTWVPMFKNELDVLPASVMSAAEYAQTFFPIASSDLTNGVGLVGIPLEYDGLTMFVNEDIFTLAGKIPPTNWNDFRNVAVDLTIKDDQGIITQAGAALGRVENVDHWQEILGLMMLQNGANLAKPIGVAAEGALSFFTLFSSSLGVWDATLPPSTSAFAAGKLAMYFGPSWRAFEIKEQNPNLKFKAVPVPQLAKEGTRMQNVAYASYWAEGVWARGKNKQVAWDFLKFLSSKESLQKMYQSASQVRLFGEPYSRIDMAQLLATDPILGPIMADAANAQSWYLASRTYDGPTGINSQISKYFEDCINSVNSGTNPVNKALETAANGVAQVLSQYGLVSQ